MGSLNPALATTMNLGNPGPRLVPRFWSAVLEAMNYVDIDEAVTFGKKAEQLAQQLPVSLRHSLLFEVAQGLRCEAGSCSLGC